MACLVTPLNTVLNVKGTPNHERPESEGVNGLPRQRMLARCSEKLRVRVIPKKSTSVFWRADLLHRGIFSRRHNRVAKGQQEGTRALHYVLAIMPAPTVPLVASSTRMKLPVVRFRR